MKWKAVIFDLYGTLVDNFSYKEHEHMLKQMAKVLSARQDDFATIWVETFNDRATGAFLTVEENIEYVCKVLGCSVTSAQIEEAASIRVRFIKHTLVPRSGVLNLLTELKSKGYKTGLITDCSSELPLLWTDTPLATLIDAAIFSCKVGVRKPHSKIYMVACEKLRVNPQDCVYVGDGGSSELTGAAVVGMQPLLLYTSSENTNDVYRIDVEEWTGPSISDLKELLKILKPT